MSDAFVLTQAHGLAHYLSTAVVPDKATLARYQAADHRARGFPADAKLVLDTNVLLRYYQLPLKERRRLYAFLEQQQGRLYLSEQVRREFERQAPTLRQQQRAAVRWKRPTLAQQALIEEVADDLCQHAGLLRSYPQLQADWQAVQAHLPRWLKRLGRHAEAQVAEGRRHLAAQDVAHLVPHFQSLPTLSKKEYQRLKQQVRGLAATVQGEATKGFNDAAAAYAYRYPERVFPGLGDALLKANQGLSDYVIYHELLKWVATTAAPATFLFLTLDSSKGDWMTLRQTPYTHYQHHFDTHTGRLCHFLPAEAWLADHAAVDTTPLQEASAIWPDLQQALWAGDPLLVGEVKDVLGQLYPHRAAPETVDWEALVDTLAEGGIATRAQLYTTLLEVHPQLLRRELATHHVCDRVEALRLALNLRG